MVVPPLRRRILVELELVVILRRELRLVGNELELFLDLLRRPARSALLPPRRVPFSAGFRNALNDVVVVRRGEVRAETTLISLPQEGHKPGSSNHTLAINLAQFLRLNLTYWTVLGLTSCNYPVNRIPGILETSAFSTMNFSRS